MFSSQYIYDSDWGMRENVPKGVLFFKWIVDIKKLCGRGGEMNASFNRVITSEPFYHKLNIQLITLYKLFGLTVDSHDMTSTPLEDFLWVYF